MHYNTLTFFARRTHGLRKKVLLKDFIIKNNNNTYWTRTQRLPIPKRIPKKNIFFKTAYDIKIN